MAYVYQVSFDIRPEQMHELAIGASLERVLGYLRALLPSEIGFVTARAMRSLGHTERTRVVIESTWQQWDDLEKHRQSALAEDKVVLEFQPHVSVESLQADSYQEVD